ncbi:hypothetical protein pb186bvf_000077 [Paramecium bursaria]
MLLIKLLHIGLVLSYRTIQFERGNDFSVRYNTGHILERQSAVPRSAVINIKFKKPFLVIPQVAAIPYWLEWQSESPCGFRVEVTDITLTDFNVRISAVAERQLYSVYLNWFAFFDPRIIVTNFETTDIAALKSGQGNRQVSFTIPINFPGIKVAASFLTGVRHIKTNPIVNVVVDSFTPKQVSILMSTYWEAAVEMVRVVIIAGTDSALWASPPQRFNAIPGSDNPFVKRIYPTAAITIALDTPKVWQSGPRQFIYGFTGYDVERTKNFRIFVFGVIIEKQILNYQIQTWQDSIVYGIYTQAALYVADNNLKIFDTECAEIFDKCDYQGDSITICDRIPDLPKEGWAKPVKSIQVPANRVLYLFNKEKFDGQRVAYRENQKCLSSISFTFAQLEQVQFLGQ